MKLTERSNESHAYMTQNACDKTNTLSKMINCAVYTMICIHYLVWSLVRKQRNSEIKSTQTNSERKPSTMSRKNDIRQWKVIHRKHQEQDRYA